MRNQNTVSTLGIQWKAYYADPLAWPPEAYHDDTQVSVNGKTDDSIDLGEVADTDVLLVSGGVIFYPDGQEFNLVEHFAAWIQTQSTTYGAFCVPKDKLQAVQDAILGAGATLLDPHRVALFNHS